MTNMVMRFVRDIKNNFNVKGKILDVGSFDVNGSLKSIFENDSEYTGLDMREGKNVDVVANAHNIPFSDNYFDCVCCVEMLEHDDNFFKSISEMKRVLKPKGFLILTSPTIGFVYHPHPKDYWRFTKDSFELFFKDFSNTYIESRSSNILGYGQK